jgi:DNA-binding response OmpR family regulator
MRKRLLIVEDDQLTAELNRRVVARLGFEVCGVAASAAEAVRLAHAEHPDLVLMDIGLAGPRDGIQVACEIRRVLGIPSLFLTGETGIEVRIRAAQAFPLGFLIKPLLEADLRDCLERSGLDPAPGRTVTPLGNPGGRAWTQLPSLLETQATPHPATA